MTARILGAVRLISDDQLSALKWLERQLHRDGELLARAIHPLNADLDVTGMLMHPRAVPAHYLTKRCPMNLAAIHTAHTAWKYATAPEMPEGPWPFRQLTVPHQVATTRAHVTIWVNGLEVMRLRKSEVDATDPTMVLRTDGKEWFLWLGSSVVSRNPRR